LIPHVSCLLIRHQYACGAGPRFQSALDLRFVAIIPPGAAKAHDGECKKTSYDRKIAAQIASMSIETLKTESAGVACGSNMFATGCTLCPNTRTAVAHKRAVSLKQESTV
jgi:hypothetical protein